MSQLSRPSTRVFVITEYRQEGDGVAAAIPLSCPFRVAGDDPCQVGRHHLRGRTTGPCFPLQVVRCHVHCRHFTLYPPGYAPYQRKPVRVLAPDGSAPRQETEQSVGPDFEGTLFEAALDAREGRAWARNPDDVKANQVPDRWWRTQIRHLDRALLLLGLALHLCDRTRETVASLLSVGLLLIQEHSCASDVGYRNKGRAIGAVLGAIPLTRSDIHLLACGFIAGLWGEPWRWDVRTRRYERVFHPGTGPPS